MNENIFAIDLGKLTDYTAFAILTEVHERSVSPTALDVAVKHEGRVRVERFYRLNGLSQPPLRTPYMEIAKRVKEIVNAPGMVNNCDLLVDATGVGQAVVEIFQDIGLHPIPVTIQAGAMVTQSPDGGFRVPKAEIAGALQALFGTHSLRIPPNPLRDTLVQEIEKFVMKHNASTNNLSYEAWREADHDDLVFAVGLAAWWARFTRPRFVQADTLEEDSEEPPYNPKSSLLSVYEERRLTGHRKRRMD